MPKTESGEIAHDFQPLGSLSFAASLDGRFPYLSGNCATLFLPDRAGIKHVDGIARRVGENLIDHDPVVKLIVLPFKRSPDEA